MLIERIQRLAGIKPDLNEATRITAKNINDMANKLRKALKKNKDIMIFANGTEYSLADEDSIEKDLLWVTDKNGKDHEINLDDVEWFTAN